MRLSFPVKLLIGTIGLFLILASGSLAVLAYTHQDKYYPGVRVGGIKLAGVAKEEGERRLRERVEQLRTRPVVVTLPDISQARLESTGEYPEIEVTTTAEEIGMSYGADQAIERGFAVGHQSNLWQWLSGTLTTLFQEERVPLTYSVDTEQVRTFVHTQVVPQIVNPVPAKLRVEGDQVLIDDPKPGIEVDSVLLTEKIIKQLPSTLDGDASYLRAPVKQIEASVSRATVQPYADKLSALGDLSLTLSAGDKKVQPKRAELLTWFSLVQAEDGTMTMGLNQEQVDSYLDSVKVDRLDSERSLTAVTNALERVLVEQAKNSEAELASQSVALVQKAEQKNEVTAGSGYTLGRYDGKYIEVSLKEQKLYRIEGNSLVKVYRVSTGKWSTPTPKGTFSIATKVPRAYSRTYGLYMPYWMNFLGTPEGQNEALPVGSYGLHELPEWPNGYKEGQSHLGTAVSHGCIRLGVGDAAEVYGWADSGTPVVIH